MADLLVRCSFLTVLTLPRTSSQFAGAKGFNRNLCAWGSRLADNVVASGIFVSSACLNRGDPDPDNPAAGPLCRDCNAERRRAVAPLSHTP